MVGSAFLAACGSGGGETSPTSSPGTCESSGTGPEVTCELEVGTYRTIYSLPGMTYTVPDPGWGSLDRPGAPGNFVLIPVGGGTPDDVNQGLSDDVNLFAAVAPPGHCTGEPSTELPHTYDGMVAFLTTNPGITVTNIQDVSVGGLDGMVMDLAMAEGGDGCPDGTYVDLFIGIAPAHGPWGFSAEPGQVVARMFVLDYHSDALALEVDDVPGGSDYGDGEDWLGVGASVARTFVFP